MPSAADYELRKNEYTPLGIKEIVGFARDPQFLTEMYVFQTLR